MTVIAYDGKTLAADRLKLSNDLKTITKKIMVKNNIVFAITGTLCHFEPLIDWYIKGANPNDYPKFQSTDDWSRLIVFENGKLFHYESEPYKLHIKEKIAAFGSGRDFALGALAMGADAKTAIKIASRFCTSCGMGIDAVDLTKVRNNGSA